MQDIISTLRSANIQPEVFLKAAAVLLGGGLVLSIFSRVVFKKHSGFSHAVSSAIGILFVYAVVVVVYSLLPVLRHYAPPLPFVILRDNKLILFSFPNAPFTLLCSQLMSMVALAFLANLLDEWIPDGPNAFTWFLSKCANVAGGVAILVLIHSLADKYIQEGLLQYLPTVLFVLLMIFLFMGILKVLIGLFLTTVHPILGAFYTFFFSTGAGKAISRGVMTTGILTALVYALAYIGCTALSILPAALIAYFPLVIMLGLLWYGTNKLL